jgi:tetratricopeptide (TPR) repeat protein
MTQLLFLLWRNFKEIFQALGGWIARTATFGKLVTLGPLVVVSPLVVHELTSDLVTIEPIEVPKALSDSGYSPGVAGHRLRDAMNAYAGTISQVDYRINLNRMADDTSLKSNLDLNISAAHKPPDIVIPQIGLSLGAMISFLRSAAHRTGHAISGELTSQDKKYALRLRINGQQVFSSDYEAENPDDLMTKAAPGVMEIIRPAAHAIARYRVRKEEGLLKADEIIAQYDKSNINVQWAYLLKGKHALEQKKYEQAEEMFSNAVKSNRRSEQPHMQLGIARLRAGNFDGAISEFRNVLAINPKSAKAYNNIGVSMAAQANWGDAGTDAAKLEEAIAEYRQAIKAEPGYVLSYNNLGIALFYQKKIDEAITQYRSAIEITPAYLDARWNLAFALSQSNFDEAVAEYRTAIKLAIDPKQRAELHTFLGDFLWEQAGKDGDLEPAIAEYRQAIEINCYSWAHNNLGTIWEKQSKIHDAIAEYEKAMRCEPKNAAFEKNLQRVRTQQEASAITVGTANR